MKYYKPQSRKSLVLWLKNYYPDMQYSNKTIEQLWAIYYSIINKHEKGGQNEL